MCDVARQVDELLALENIYTQEEFKSVKENEHSGGQFLAFVVLDNELKLLFKDLRVPDNCFQEIVVDHLPPLSLLFSFPKDYPSSCPPDFTLSCQWLRRTDITKLCKKLDELWNENESMEIMYIWTQFLKEEALKFLSIDKELDISKMYTYYLKYTEYVNKRNKGLLKKRVRSSSGRTSVRVSVGQKSAEKGVQETTSSKADEDSNEHSRCVVDSDHCAGYENHIGMEKVEPSAVKPTEENKLLEVMGQDSCNNNTSPAEKNVSNNATSHFSKRNSRHKRRQRLSTELNKHKENLQKNAELSTKCDMYRNGEVECRESRTVIKDTVNDHNVNDNVNSKFGEMQVVGHVTEVKFNDCNGLNAENTSLSEVYKVDVASELAPETINTSGRRKGTSQHQRSARRPRSCPAEKEKETRQRQVKNKHRSDLDIRAVVDLSPGTSVIQHLLDYNNRQREIEFQRSLHTCKICFEYKLGANCMKFEPCWHVFCSDCITNYFEVRIREGTVLSIHCPEDKCTSEAQPSHVQALVSSELYTKYDSILLSAALESQVDGMYCPRQQCQYPVFHDDKDGKLATCPECNYAFCILCKRVYHGVAPCVAILEEKRKLMQEYVKANDIQKKEMEAKYGKKQLKNLVDIFHLEKCESWIKEHSKKCPHCKTSIEKESGCNRMQCWKCETLFCWLCGLILNKLKPYAHYNDPNSPCYNTLLEGILIEDDFEQDFDQDFDD